MKAIFYNQFKDSYIPNILKEIYIDKIYDKFFTGKSNMTVVDAGANIGLFSMYASPYAKSVYAIEPSKEHVNCMREMIKSNGFTNIEVLDVALSDSDGERLLNHCSNVTMYSLKDGVNNTGNGEMVKTISFDTLIQKTGDIDFLKLDIEGSEFDVLNSDGFKSNAKRVKCMVGECHAWAGVNPNQVTTVLNDLGFKVEWRDLDDVMLFITYLL
jgi:FkbM family methyltransferase